MNKCKFFLSGEKAGFPKFFCLEHGKDNLPDSCVKPLEEEIEGLDGIVFAIEHYKPRDKKK